MDGTTNPSNDFSGVPSLDDTAGLNAYLESEQMAAQGIQPQAPAAPAPAADQATQTTQTNNGASTTTQPDPNAATAQTGNMSSANVDQIMARLDAINKQLAAPTQATAPVTAPAPTAGGYTAQERAFINAALARGYTLDQINATIMSRRTPTAGANSAIEQRMANLENYLKRQEYEAAQSAFIDKLSTFGDKYGLSEQDLVTFGNAAFTKGINIAMPNVDLETVFKAVYPEQYRIRTQRMSPTNASQIYGGTSIPEGNRAAASRMEDAYVDQFLKQAMPNYGKH